MNNEEKILEMLEKLSDKVEQIGTGQAALEDRIGQLEEGQANIKVLLDADIRKQLDILGEGDEAITERLDRIARGLDRVEAMAEDTKDMMDVVYTVVKQHGSEIEELKKAQ